MDGLLKSKGAISSAGHGVIGNFPARSEANPNPNTLLDIIIVGTCLFYRFGVRNTTAMPLFVTRGNAKSYY